MFTLVIVLIIIASVLLVVVVLAQNPKGGGLSSQFGGTGSSQLMGVKRTGDFLEKTTWVLAIAIVAFCLTSFAFINAGNNAEGLSTPGMEKAGDQTIIDMNQEDVGEPLGVDTAEEQPVIEEDLEGLFEEDPE